MAPFQPMRNGERSLETCLLNLNLCYDQQEIGLHGINITMTNSTKGGNYEFYCPLSLYGLHLRIIMSTLNIPLSVTAVMGNILIIAALRKIPTSSLHPPSKFLFSCLACTDLGVGLITQPLFLSFSWSTEHSKPCYYLVILLYTIGGTFCGVSSLTVTTISVDRLLAMLLRLRYRQVVTLKRVRLALLLFWLLSSGVAMTMFHDLRLCTTLISIILSVCLMISTVCYVIIYRTLRQHQNQVQDIGYHRELNKWDNPSNIARYKKTVSSALWVQLALLACYLPYGTVAAVFAMTRWRTASLDLALDATLTLLFCNSAVNPFLYCWKNKEIRNAVKQRTRQCLC